MLTMTSKNIEILERWLSFGVYQRFGVPDKVLTVQMDKKLALDSDPLGNPQGTGDLDSRGRIRSRL